MVTFSTSAECYVADFNSFAAFYPYDLSQHSHRVCRRWHFIGSTLVLAIVLLAVVTRQWGWLWLLPLAGYGCAWIGHYVYQKNRPATFTHPLYSLRGDWVMYGQMLRGKLRF
jgi:hypothetical protein